MFWAHSGTLLGLEKEEGIPAVHGTARTWGRSSASGSRRLPESRPLSRCWTFSWVLVPAARSSTAGSGHRMQVDSSHLGLCSTCLLSLCPRVGTWLRPSGAEDTSFNSPASSAMGWRHTRRTVSYIPTLDGRRGHRHSPFWVITETAQLPPAGDDPGLLVGKAT